MEIHRSIKILIILSLICTSLLAQSQDDKTIMIELTGITRPYTKPIAISSKKRNRRLFYKKTFIKSKNILKSRYFHLNQEVFSLIYRAINSFPFNEIDSKPNIVNFQVYIYEKKKLIKTYFIPNNIIAKEFFSLLVKEFSQDKHIKSVSVLIFLLERIITIL